MAISVRRLVRLATAATRGAAPGGGHAPRDCDGADRGTGCRRAEAAQHRAGPDGRLLTGAPRDHAAGPADARRAGRAYENAFVIDSLCCPSRAALFTGQTPHQTRVRTNTPNDPEARSAVTRRSPSTATWRKQFKVALERQRLHDRLRRQVPEPLRGDQQQPHEEGAATVPGWTDFKAVLGGAYNGWGYLSTRFAEDGRLALDNHPVPDRTSTAQIDKSYARNVASDMARRLPATGTAATGRRTSWRSRPTRRTELERGLSRQPVFPPALADRAAAGDPAGGNCGPKACSQLTLRDLWGTTTRAPTTRRRTCGRTAAPLRRRPGGPTRSRSPTRRR